MTYLILLFALLNIVSGFSPFTIPSKNRIAKLSSAHSIYNSDVGNSTLSVDEIEKLFNNSGNNLTDLQKKMLQNHARSKEGYPKQAFQNITVSEMSDSDFDDDDMEQEFEKLLNKLFNNQDGPIYIPKEPKDPNIPHSRNRPAGASFFPQNARYNPETQQMEKEMQPLGVRVIRINRGEGLEKRDGKKSENFEIETNVDFNFTQVGGYKSIKEELNQSVDMLTNYEKYKKFNVRVPKGLILEGPPGNGKTLIAKAFSGEVNASFIAVSGSQFLEKYVGVGASRVRELFELAKENVPCIIFIDEIDAIGRSRGGSDQTNQNSEAQSTLNELLVSMDGYKGTDGIFVIGATNRVDLLDQALIRPGRIDKKIYIGNPDAKTREEILKIHIKGKPVTNDVVIDNMIDITNGLSGAQIENLLNEAMLYSIRNDREVMSMDDIEVILARILVGYQSSENVFSEDMIKRIAIHEMGHALSGILSLHHSKIVKVCLNLWSPTSPGYTIFENVETDVNIYTKEKLVSRLVVLLAGRVAEEVFFGASITTGASKDIEEAYTLAEQMIVKFGMGKRLVVPYYSETSKVNIDRDIERLVDAAYHSAHAIIIKTKPIIEECAEKLIKTKLLLPDEIYAIMKKHNVEH